MAFQMSEWPEQMFWIGEVVTLIAGVWFFWDMVHIGTLWTPKAQIAYFPNATNYSAGMLRY